MSSPCSVFDFSDAFTPPMPSHMKDQTAYATFGAHIIKSIQDRPLEPSYRFDNPGLPSRQIKWLSANLSAVGFFVDCADRQIILNRQPGYVSAASPSSPRWSALLDLKKMDLETEAKEFQKQVQIIVKKIFDGTRKFKILEPACSYRAVWLKNIFEALEFDRTESTEIGREDKPCRVYFFSKKDEMSELCARYRDEIEALLAAKKEEVFRSELGAFPTSEELCEHRDYYLAAEEIISKLVTCETGLVEYDVTDLNEIYVNLLVSNLNKIGFVTERNVALITVYFKEALFSDEGGGSSAGAGSSLVGDKAAGFTDFNWSTWQCVFMQKEATNQKIMQEQLNAIYEAIKAGERVISSISGMTPFISSRINKFLEKVLPGVSISLLSSSIEISYT
jgi:hypothetical protein